MNRSQVLEQTIKDLYGVQIDNVEGILKTGGLAGLRKALDTAGVESAEKQLQNKVEGEPPVEGEPKPSEGGVAELMKEMIDGMANLEKRFGEYKAMVETAEQKRVAAETEVKALKQKHVDDLAELEKRVKAVESELAIKPRSAVGHEGSAEIGDKLKNNLPENMRELDPLFRELGVRKQSG